MSRPQTESIREFILDRVADGPKSVARQVAQAYGISRQAANRHLDALVEAGVLEQDGATRSKEYRLRRVAILSREVRVTPVLNADRLWSDHIAPVLAGDRAATRDLCRGAFGELVGNIIAHAGASWINMSFEMTARSIEVVVEDDGHGIFNRLAERIGGSSARGAAELMVRHANQRSMSFPASRLSLLARNFESFVITSSGETVAYFAATDSWSVTPGESPAHGTRVSMRLCRAEKAAGVARLADSFASR
jgi:DNA-binding transcriptional ArsR family regulator